jgi:hypothetical protein
MFRPKTEQNSLPDTLCDPLCSFPRRGGHSSSHFSRCKVLQSRQGRAPFHDRTWKWARLHLIVHCRAEMARLWASRNARDVLNTPLSPDSSPAPIALPLKSVPQHLNSSSDPSTDPRVSGVRHASPFRTASTPSLGPTRLSPLGTRAEKCLRCVSHNLSLNELM